jgi:hypothetical protein
MKAGGSPPHRKGRTPPNLRALSEISQLLYEIPDSVGDRFPIPHTFRVKTEICSSREEERKTHQLHKQGPFNPLN